jgi:hypothetical protein
MKFRIVAALFAVLALAIPATVRGGERQWQKGRLTDSGQSRVKEGSTTNSNTDGSIKQSGDKTKYSGNTTSTTNDNYETYQTYTIEGEKKIYIAREHLLFPWSKAANVTVGEEVKFAIEKGKLYIQGRRRQGT